MARIFVDVQNVALLTNYAGFDPELFQTLSTVQPSPNPYPPAVSTTVGVNLTF
jgi:hypothetical protein